MATETSQENLPSNEEVEDMQDALKDMATQDKQAKLGAFTQYEDEIRDVKDKSSKDLIEPHAFNEADTNNDNKPDPEDEKDAMKEKLEELATEDKQAKIQKFVENQDDIRPLKDKSTKDVIQPHAFNEDGANDDKKTNTNAKNTNDTDAMKEKLEELVTDDKQTKMGKFIKREDEIRNIKDTSSKDVIEPHAFNETPDKDTNDNKQKEPEPDPKEMKAKLQELATEDKQAKLEEFAKNQDDIRGIKDKSSENLLEPNAFNATPNDDKKETEEQAMKRKLEELVTEDKHAKLEKFIKHEDEIRDPKDRSSTDLLQAHGFNYNDMSEGQKQDQKEDKQRADYFAVTTERRTRFQVIMNKFDDLKFKLAKKVVMGFTLNNDIKFQTVTSAYYAKAFKKEPTVWYIETVMPGAPLFWIKHWGESENRMKWDTQISSHTKISLFEDDKTSLHVVNNKTTPALGGVISPRQFTAIVQRWTLEGDVDGLEIASQSIEHEKFPAQKGYVDGHITLSAMKVTAVTDEELKEKYKIPEIMVKGKKTAKGGDDDAKDNDEQTETDDGGKEKLKWSRCQSLLQTDIKGWLPTKVVEAGISGGMCSTYQQCREYMFKSVYGFDIKVEKISG